MFFNLPHADQVVSALLVFCGLAIVFYTLR